MKLSEIVVGEVYLCKVSGRIVPVKVEKLSEILSFKGRYTTHIICRNTLTGRQVVCRSPQRLRRKVEPKKTPIPDGTPGPKSMSELFRF